MGGFPNSPATGPASGVTLDAPPASPSQSSSVTNLGWGAKPDGGLGPEASNPQVMALQGTQLMKMGAQVLSAALPVLAQILQAFMQQLETVVPQAMSQSMGGAPAAGPQMGTPSPVPPAPGPQGMMPGGGGGAPMM
jgi:hypothetical protein